MNLFRKIKVETWVADKVRKDEYQAWILKVKILTQLRGHKK